LGDDARFSSTLCESNLSFRAAETRLALRRARLIEKQIRRDVPILVRDYLGAFQMFIPQLGGLYCSNAVQFQYS
jgi:hypothetical protein